MGDTTEPEHFIDFDYLVAQAEQEVGASVGADKPLEAFGKEPDVPPTELDAIKTRQRRRAPGDFIAPAPLPSERFDIELPRPTPAARYSAEEKDEYRSALEREKAKDDAEYWVWYATNRKPKLRECEFVGFTGERDKNKKTRYGKCRVFIPKGHKFGSTGSGFWKRLFLGDDRLQLLETIAYKPDAYWQEISGRFNACRDNNEKRAVVFIHGYNVSFRDAALRTAQIGFDLGIETPVAFFSWPSKGKLFPYSKDTASIGASAKAIEDFLLDFTEKSGATSLHVIAHSMGNRGLLRAVSSIVQKVQDRKIFGQVILAAADVDLDEFTNYCAAYPKLSERTTLYVSKRDNALRMSRMIYGDNRVGFIPPIQVFEGIDTVNVTRIDLSQLGHGYIAEAWRVLLDIKRIIFEDKSPSQRWLYEKRNEDGDTYWEFDRPMPQRPRYKEPDGDEETLEIPAFLRRQT